MGMTIDEIAALLETKTRRFTEAEIRSKFKQSKSVRAEPTSDMSTNGRVDCLRKSAIVEGSAFSHRTHTAMPKKDLQRADILNDMVFSLPYVQSARWTILFAYPSGSPLSDGRFVSCESLGRFLH